MNRYALRDDQWERIKDLLPGKPGDVGVTARYLSEQEKRALVVAAENIPGVRRVEDHMRRVGTTLLD